MNIVFYGTPEIAAYNLRYLYNSGFQIDAVVTTPDKPAGRGLKLRPSPVKLTAEELNLPVLQPQSLKDPDFVNEIKKINPTVQVVVAFRILPEQIWKIPPKGTINLHTSYLPNYRGAAPINWVIINGEKYTGVTTFFINNKVDEGNIILRQKVEIYPNDTAGTLHDRLMHEGAKLLVKTLKLIESDQVTTIPQEQLMHEITELKTAPKISKDMCQINWNWPAEKIYNFIRGLSPYPGAWTTLYDKSKNTSYKYAKIFWAVYHITPHNLTPGTIITDDKTFMKVAAADGFVDIKQIQLPGKKQLSIDQFLRGFKASNLEIR